jgi:hypothetical protein
LHLVIAICAIDVRVEEREDEAVVEAKDVATREVNDTDRSLIRK